MSDHELSPAQLEAATIQRRTMTDLQQRIGEWGDKTFPRATLHSIHDHLSDEVEELADNIMGDHDYLVGMQEEAADCAILLFQLAHHAGFDLLANVEDKFATNQLRQWGEPDERGVVKHVEATDE